MGNSVYGRGPVKFNRIEIVPGGSLIGGGQDYQGNQKFYVNTASATYPGNDNNDGLSYLSPLLTITAALAKCVDGRNDVIYIIDYWQASGETWPISIEKRAVHIIGVALPGLPYPAIHPSTDVAAFQLNSSGQYGSIGYLTIGGGSSRGGIAWQNAGQVDGFRIHNNVFGHQWFGTPLNGIEQVSTASRGGYGNIIEDNTFMGDLANCTGAITGNASDMLGTVNSYDLIIRNNRFMGCAVGINLTDVSNAQIYGNKFVCADSADGEAITLLTACRGCMVDDNVAMNGGDAVMGQQPYRDVAATNKNHWGLNWTTNAVDLPKQT